MNQRLLTKVREAKRRGHHKGELSAGKKYREELDQLMKEHERQVAQLNNAHKREVKMLEKEYNLKAGQLDKKIDRLNSLIHEWESKVSQAKDISAQSQELLARVKQAMYQDRKVFATLLDDEKTVENLQGNLNNMLQKKVRKPADMRLA